METTSSTETLVNQDVNKFLLPYANMGNHLILDFNNVTNVDLKIMKS